MKKLIRIVVIALLIAAIIIVAMPTPVAANWPGAPCGAVGGEPPGWSYVSKGNGGSGTPGVGPFPH